MGIILSKVDFILKHYVWIQNIYKFVMGFFFRTLGLFLKTDEKLILFNAHGRKYNDSPRKIYEHMISQKDLSGYKYVWALDSPEKYNIPNANKVKMDTLQYFVTALKAKYWVTCVNIERGLNFKKKNTVYLNTWHGIPMKTIGNSVKGRTDFNFENIDLFCYSSQYEKDIYIRDFNVKEESLILTGLPRNDELYSVTPDKIKEYRDLLNIPSNKKVILYAPTWRDSEDIGKNYSIKPPIDIDIWRKELERDYVILFRTHSYTNNIIGIEFDEFIRDLTDYPEINHLLIASDILISDYSATIFDFAILEKPIVCFAYDYQEYKVNRGLYLNLELDLPNGIIRNQMELIDQIKKMNYSNECRKVAGFKKKYHRAGGSATSLCTKQLLELKTTK